MNDWTGYLGGHPQAITPNLDALARRGVNFSNAHCPAPGCSPSRNSILYGVEPFNSGLYAFYDQEGFTKEQKSRYTAMTEFFKMNGYNTYGSGKIHHRREPTSVEWTEFYEREKGPQIVYDPDIGYQQGKSSKMNFKPTLNPLEDHNDYKNTSFGVDVLNREHDKPFFLAVGIVKPHLPFVAPKRFFDMYPDPVKAPAINPNDHNDIPAVGRSMAKVGDDRKFKAAKAWDDVRRAYLACITWADYNIGRLIDALEASPYADNTIVVLWSDHGYGMGEKKHFRKFALWEETTKVPFIILDTRDDDAPEGREVRGGVSLVNIYQTLADMSGLEAPEHVDGFSLAPQLADPDATLAGPAICSWGRGNYTVRDERWRYTRYYDGGEELYDHSKDSNEWDNLANNPEYSGIKGRLMSQLPTNEAPLIMDGMEEWSLPVSSDKHLNSRK
ncbi:sulfatase [Pelagicoccus mobilis]|uniref:Sulfatase n=2 Tax=Pelagicoccus mobilis TaxID=415221 RepID=A0A934VPT8_9BACT|nr:sulfatase [Pelagicoccus mobilis]